MNDFERRAFNGVRAYNLARGGTRLGTDWTAKMWYSILAVSADPQYPNAAVVLSYYGVEPA